MKRLISMAAVILAAVIGLAVWSNSTDRAAKRELSFTSPSSLAASSVSIGRSFLPLPSKT